MALSLETQAAQHSATPRNRKQQEKKDEQQVGRSKDQRHR